MFTQVRTHFTVNTPRLIVHTCSEDCSKVTKYFFCPPLQMLKFFLAELEIRGLAGKGPTNRGRNLGCDHTRPDSFLCRHETFSCIVWTPIWYVTLHFKRSARCSFARYRNRAEISVLIYEQKPYPLWFLCRRKSYPVLCKHSLRLSDGRQNTPQHLENRSVVPNGWRLEACHAYRIFFFTKSIVCLYLDSSWHLLQVCWRRKAFLARFGKEGSLAGKCICRNVRNMEFNYKQFGDVISSFTFTHI